MSPTPHHLRILSANHVSRAGLVAEHGLAVWIESNGYQLLWDTGQGFALAHNAQRMNIDLAAIDAVALSHGHFDHTGGLHLLDAPLFCHPDAVRPRYSLRPSGEKRLIGMPAPPAGFTPVTQPTELDGGIWLTGPVPRPCEFELQPHGRFFLDDACTIPDPINDDQALFFDTPKGVVVVLGCAHAGVINTLQYIHGLSGRPIRALIGGTHLIGTSPDRIAKTIHALRTFDIPLLCVGHCTSPPAEHAITAAFPDRTTPFEVGADFTF